LRDEKFLGSFGLKAELKCHLRGVNVDVRIILKCILNKESVGLIDLTHGSVQLQAYVNTVVDLRVLQ
jgi:hypothetical protein